jgi:hypothetical protein
MILRIGAWRRVAVGFTAALLASALAWFSATAYVSRSVAAPTMAERQLAYDRAAGWIRQNEASVLNEGNSALWWMINVAAQTMDDSYLLELVRRWKEIHVTSSPLASAWVRMVDPKSPASDLGYNTQALGGYQKFFLHALTCQPLEMDDGDSSVFTRENMCRPQTIKVMRGEPACTTHQLMGLQLYKRSHCVEPPGMSELEAQLFDDVLTQLQWDPRVRDVYIQRVLVLQWFGRSDQIKAIWLKRVLAAQQTDGGWAWNVKFPELPAWLQSFRSAWQTLVLQNVPDQHDTSDLHPTAQGLLLMALSLRGNSPASAMPAQ